MLGCARAHSAGKRQIIWIALDITVQYNTFTVPAPFRGETIASAKTATLTFRIEPEFKAAVRTAAVNEHRSIANMIAVMIRNYFRRVGVQIQDPEVQPPKANRRTKKK